MDEARIEEEVVADMTILDSSGSDVVGPKKLCQSSLLNYFSGFAR